MSRDIMWSTFTIAAPLWIMAGNDVVGVIFTILSFVSAFLIINKSNKKY